MNPQPTPSFHFGKITRDTFFFGKPVPAGTIVKADWHCFKELQEANKVEPCQQPPNGVEVLEMTDEENRSPFSFITVDRGSEAELHERLRRAQPRPRGFAMRKIS